MRPNFDTLYSIAWFDLTKEPVIITVPDSQGRYYMIPILDMWTDVVAIPGRRTSGIGPGEFTLTSPGWTGTLPDGLRRIPVPTPYAWTIGRTQTNGPKDYAAVNHFQDGFGVNLLSDWGGKPRPAVFTYDPSVDMKTPPLVQVNKMSAEAYFTYGLQLMQLHPPHVTDGSMLLRMEHLGFKVGAPLDFASLDASIKLTLAEGLRDGLEEMQSFMTTRTTPRDGWLVLPPGPIGVYGNDYLYRAVVAMIGLGANPVDDAIYPVNISDADGKPPIGEYRYTMHFAADKLPPVGAFWSLSMYDYEGFPVPNKINRCAIGDRDDLMFNADGSLDIYIQHKSPGADNESNWLPSPANGKLGLTMRLYEPEPAVLCGEWSPPPLVKVD